MSTELATIEPGMLVQLATPLPADENPARVYIASLQSPASQRTMIQALDAIADAVLPGSNLDTFPWGGLRRKYTMAIQAKLAATHNAATANKMLSALRRTLDEAWDLGQIPTDEYMKARKIKNVKGEKPDQAAGRALKLGELMALVASCQDGTPSGARDAAILAVAYSCGLRRAEIVGLDLVDFNRAEGVFTVKGKRNKVRTVPIQNGARQAVNDWLAIRGEDAGALFLPISKGNRITRKWIHYDAAIQAWVDAEPDADGAKLQGMTTQAVYYIMSERAKAAGVDNFSPHDMRRTFAGDLLDAGADIATVQKMMGHANVSTTAGYDRRGERAKQDAAKRLHFPYQHK